ncbi:TY-Chap domain-containing protein [Devosia riboflavina]|uniref:TY-Chap domain-containing protein n=1 Tax=Devosia riboflavina TaxID=46914 RepID=UPI000A5DF5F7|nr:hypothetical protein [Devosia riboflavina]
MLNGVRRGLSLILLLAMLGPLQAKATEEAGSAFVEALENIAAISRPGQVGDATIWDGNKYVQCYTVDAGTTRCEAAGSLMQPSLKRAMRPDDLLALGWTRDDSFGNFVKTFPAEAGPADIAAAAVAALTEAYDAEPEWFEVQTQWLPDTKCPPRNGPTQNLAGMINAMPASVIACSYAEAMMLPAALAASPDLYEPAIAAEIQRLRVNASESVFAVFDAGIGYVQCAPDQASSAIYCEAQSAESWPALATILTPERVDLLHTAGYSDPGRSPNYWKNYAMDRQTDLAIAGEILTLLRDVYGFTGEWDLEVHTD